MAGVGSLPVGQGPVGGLEGSGLFVDGLDPAANATGVNPKPLIIFDVKDINEQLDPATVRVKVNGEHVYDATHNPKFHNGWTGVVSDVDGGKHYELQAPDFLGDGATVLVQVFCSDTEGNSAEFSWQFTTAVAASIVSATPVGDRCLLIEFSPRVIVDNELYRSSNYAFPVRLGYAKEAYAGTVTPESPSIGALVNFVTVCARDYFSRNGRYSVRVDGIHDEYGRTVRAEL